MASVDLFNMKGEKTGTLELNDAVFGVTINEHVLHLAVVQYLANQRQGTKGTKTRAEVRGGGRKPWRQKGTGRARQGSIRSPQWKGGGVVFAPKSRDYSLKLNKKTKRLALKCALSLKLKDSKIVVLDELALESIKTKEMKRVLDGLNVAKALVLIDSSNRNIQLSARNLADVKTASVNTINVYDLLKYDSLVVTKKAVEKLEEAYA